MSRHLEHVLAEKNEAQKTGVCTKCGPVRIHFRQDKWICGRKHPNRGLQKPREQWATGWRKGKKLEHVLTAVNEEERTGDCAKCGRVIVLKGTGSRKRKDSPWTCSRRPPGRVGGAPTMHQLTDIDEANKRAVCAVCGPIKIVWRAYKRGGGTWGCYVTRYSIALYSAHKWKDDYIKAICPYCSRSHSWLRGQGKKCRARFITEHCNRCAICKCAFTEGKPACIDHDHKTGKTRGTLCKNCNVALGLLRDDAALLKNAIAYLSS